MTGIDCLSVPVSFGNRTFSKHDSEEQKMTRYKMLSKTVADPTDDALYEYAIELQLATALQIVSPFPTPFIPQIGEFSELANILMCEKRRDRS